MSRPVLDHSRHRISEGDDRARPRHDVGVLAAVPQLPHAPGVYRFRGRGGRVLYLGRAVDLRRRVASYWGDLRDRRHLRVMVSRIEEVEAVACDSGHEAAWLERNLLHASRPPWNRSRGEEVPVCLRLDARPRRVGLSVEHCLDRLGREPVAGVELFGPYLGGARARLAVAALHRVLPVAYTADGLPASQVDLGRVLGLDGLDREALLTTVRRVLNRDPDAVDRVRRGLIARRDEAAHALAFERAGQVQAELEALDWVVSPQRVAALDPVAHDVAGWADGMLVQFAVRDGRLCSWTRRRCSETAARPHLTSTPSDWSLFADRNARLAATLAG
jgi:excinuclease ABC subunit C